MEDTTAEGKQVSSLRVMYDPNTLSPALMLDGVVYSLDPATADGIAKGLNAAVAMSLSARAAELN